MIVQKRIFTMNTFEFINKKNDYDYKDRKLVYLVKISSLTIGRILFMLQ